MITRDKSRSWAILFSAIVLLLASSLLAKRGTLVLGEEKLLELIYGMPNNLRLFFLAITLLGSAWAMAVVLIGLIMKERFDIGLRIMLAGLSTYTVVWIAKELVARPRPGELVTTILQRELLVMGYGFPSAHTALATALAVTLGVYLPKNRRYVVPAWIGLVAVSRLYLGVHAPLDIVGGFCIGLIAAVCVIIAFPPLKEIKGIRIAKARSKA